MLEEVQGAKEVDLVAVGILAEYEATKAATKSTDAVLDKARRLAAKEGDNLSVELCIGTVLADSGAQEEALQLLAKHQGSLDAVALIVQIHLAMNRVDLAGKEAAGARKWAQDSLLVNIVESWVGMREVRLSSFLSFLHPILIISVAGEGMMLRDYSKGGEKYQAAYYVFEELAQAPSTQSPHNLVSQALAELHLGRLPEAEAALQQAMQLDPENEDVLANLVVLNTVVGKDTKEAMDGLKRVNPRHHLLMGLGEKREEFGKAAERYTPKLVET